MHRRMHGSIFAFLGGRDSFDGFYPQPDQIKGLSIFMNGVDIGQANLKRLKREGTII